MEISVEEYKRLKGTEEENSYLKEQLAWFKRQLFGSKSEKLPFKERSPEVIDLFDKNLEPSVQNSAPEETESINYKRKKRSKDQNRTTLPEHLERREEIIELPEDERFCDECGNQLVEIGETITEELEIIPAQFIVRKITVKKYACKTDTLHGVYKARLPKRIIPKGIAGPQLLAYILIAKYVDHLPLTRQEQIFKRLGHRIAKSTMSDWLHQVCQKLEPLLECLKNKVLDSRIINGDETTHTVQRNAVKLSKIKGYHWVYVGDRKWVWCEWKPDRKSTNPLEFLKGFTGDHFQSDGYAGYDKVVSLYDLTHLACWAHARRKFFDAVDAGCKKAEPIVAQIAELYAIEKDVREKDFTSEKIKSERQSKSIPLLDSLFANIAELNLTATPKSNLGKACGYVLKRKTELKNYCEDGDLQIDNNIVERAIRPLALGRKNHLFSGSEKGAEFSAGFYSLIETCKLHGVNPAHYLTEVLRYLADYDGEDMSTLLPDAYALRYPSE
jgi:transposase